MEDLNTMILELQNKIKEITAYCEDTDSESLRLDICERVYNEGRNAVKNHILTIIEA